MAPSANCTPGASRQLPGEQKEPGAALDFSRQKSCPQLCAEAMARGSSSQPLGTGVLPRAFTGFCCCERRSVSREAAERSGPAPHWQPSSAFPVLEKRPPGPAIV
ncbi:hypothetical protein P7K49_020338 [Saguinus oedipus]|uniref:Uncharacterized protein n=1 Tax=Saguinus oedipus TaxID=9490 RepID=A0ABQ9UZZ3_SAGOE|nr:hypothetical protein P7K49_020338 [Saguinus oedipus]